MSNAQVEETKAKLGPAFSALLTIMLRLWAPKDVAAFLRGVAVDVERISPAA